MENGLSSWIIDNMFSIIGFAAMLIGLWVTADKTQAVFKNELGHMKSDIARLEAAQKESNKLKERMVIQEVTSDAQWKRIDETRAELEELRKTLLEK